MLLRNRVIALVLLMLFAWSGEAAAVFCPIQPLHVTLWVGDTATHPMCNFDTIQDAVDAVQCPNTVIVLTHEHTYTSQHITINNKPSMTLAGVDTPVACGTAPPVVNTYVRTIDGSGNGNKSVFSITNSDVTFQYLDITGGHTTINARGGGISAAGSSNITLQASTVDANSADFGGGIAVVDSGALTLKERVAILNNVARADGGGVFLSDSAHMDMRGELSTIAFNQATGHDGDFGFGGGVAVAGNAIADIGAPPNFSGTIGFNIARAGGGVAALGANGGRAAVRLFSVDPARPVLILANEASVHGGGIYAKPDAGLSDSFADVCAQDFRIDGNQAPDGAAVFAADDGSIRSVIYLNQHEVSADGPCSANTMQAAGISAPACGAGQTTPCNEISGNTALTVDGHPSGGAIVSGAALEIDRARVRDNDGGEMIYAYDASLLTITNSLIVDNHSQHEIVHGEIFNTITNVTIVNNTIDNGFVFFLKAFVDFQNNLVWQPGRSTIDYQADGCDGCFSAKNALVSEAASFPEGLAIVLEPSIDAFGFIDPSNANVDKRDYHLGAWLVNRVDVFAPAVDFAAPVSGDDRDLDNKPHDQDIPNVDNGAGTRDLGCFELQNNQFVNDRIFADAYGDPIPLLL